MIICNCGTMIDLDFQYCPTCHRSVLDLNIGSADISKYKLPNDIELKVKECFFENQITDNCIIYNDGVVDGFHDCATLLTCLKMDDNWGMSELMTDIHSVIYKGQVAELKIIDKVSIYKPENFACDIKGYATEAIINSFPYFICLGDSKETVKTFGNLAELAEYINTTGGDEVSAIFINKEYYDFEIKEYLTFVGTDLRFEVKSAAPF